MFPNSVLGLQTKSSEKFSRIIPNSSNEPKVKNPLHLIAFANSIASIVFFELTILFLSQAQ